MYVCVSAVIVTLKNGVQLLKAYIHTYICAVTFKAYTYTYKHVRMYVCMRVSIHS